MEFLCATFSPTGCDNSKFSAVPRWYSSHYCHVLEQVQTWNSRCTYVFKIKYTIKEQFSERYSLCNFKQYILVRTTRNTTSTESAPYYDSKVCDRTPSRMPSMLIVNYFFVSWMRRCNSNVILRTWIDRGVLTLTKSLFSPSIVHDSPFSSTRLARQLLSAALSRSSIGVMSDHSDCLQ